MKPKAAIVVAGCAFTRSAVAMVLAPYRREVPLLYAGPSADAAIAAAGMAVPVAAVVDVPAEGPGREAAIAAVRSMAKLGYRVTAIAGAADTGPASPLRQDGAHAVLDRGATELPDLARVALGEPVRADAGTAHVTVPLSAMQRRVLTMFATGSSLATIGKELGVSQETVRTHLKRIRARYREHGIDLPARDDAYRAARMAGLVG